MRKTCGGEKWGRFSRACLECKRRGGSDAQISVLPALGLLKEECGAPRGAKWGRTGSTAGVESGEETAPNSPAPRPRSSGSSPGRAVGMNRERVGVESGDEGTAWGGWWQTAFTPPLAQHSLPRVESGDDQGTPRGRKVGTNRERPGGGKWGRSGNAPGWKVGAPRGSALTPGHSAYAPGHSTRPHVGHNPITMRTAGHDHGYKSDITPAQHAKTRPRPGVTPTIHDTVFDLWTTQAQGRTQ